MSKGLSHQQLQILGLAVAISRLRNGEPVARVPHPHPHYRIPVVTVVWPDVTVAIAAHVLGGVGLRSRAWRTDDVWMETTPAALSARSSISRAVSSLVKRGSLAYRPWIPRDDDSLVYGWGYSLTADGLARGLPHEPLISDLDYRLWLLDDRKHYRGRAPAPAEWQAPVFLAGHRRASPMTWDQIMHRPGRELPAR